MFKFSDILKFPGIYSKREEKIRKVNLQLANVEENNNLLTLGGVCTSQRNQYGPKIEVHKNGKENLNLYYPVKILCSCESFKYEFAGALLKVNALLEEEYFKYNIMMHKPRKKNIYQLPSGCKHIIALARHCWGKKSIKNFGLIPNVMLQRQYMFLTMQVSMMNYNPRDPYQMMERAKMLKRMREQMHLKNLIK